MAYELELKCGFTSIQSYTTRPRRSRHEYGHIFVTDAEFDDLKDLVAYTEFDNFRYGTTAEQIEQNNLYIIDPAGVKYFKEHYHGSKHPRVIYLFTPKQDRILRMKHRGDTDAQIAQRLANDTEAFKNVHSISDIVIPNVNLEDCVDCCYRYVVNMEIANA